MSVAPSYQKYSFIGEPYTKNNKEYILIDFHGRQKEVRWYEKTSLSQIKPTKDILGFTNGYITIFRGISSENEEFFQMHEEFRYHTLFGWYLISTLSLPEQLPYGVEPVRLNWEEVSANGELLSTEAVRNAVAAKIYPQSSSIWLGSVGDRLILTLTLLRVIDLPDTKWGQQKFYLFSDASGNISSWTTSLKPLSIGQTYTLTATIKACEIYKNEKQTRLTNCRVK